MRDAPLPRQFHILFAGALVNRAGAFVVPLFAIYLTGERRLPPTTAGWIISAYGLGSLLSGPLGGALADRAGRRPTMLFALVWGAAAMLLVPLAHTPVAMAAASAHLGLAGDLYRPAVNAAVADVCPSEQRARAYGLLYWAVNLGFAIATAIGGAFAHVGFRWLFVADAATTLAFAAVVALLLPETRAPRGEAGPPPQGGLGEALADRAIVALLLTQTLVGLVFQQTQGALPVALGQRGIDAARYGLVIGSNGVLIVLLQMPTLRATAALRRTRALALACLLVAVGFGLNALPLGLPGAFGSVFVWTLGELVMNPVVPALLSDLAPPHLRARYHGMAQMSFGLCALMGPPAGMWLLEHATATGLWIACLVVGLLAAALHLQAAPRLAARLPAGSRPA